MVLVRANGTELGEEVGKGSCGPSLPSFNRVENVGVHHGGYQLISVEDLLRLALGPANYLGELLLRGTDAPGVRIHDGHVMGADMDKSSRYDAGLMLRPIVAPWR